MQSNAPRTGSRERIRRQVPDVDCQLLLPLRHADHQRLRPAKRPRALRGRHRTLLRPLPLLGRLLRHDSSGRDGSQRLPQVFLGLNLRHGFLRRPQPAQGVFYMCSPVSTRADEAPPLFPLAPACSSSGPSSRRSWTTSRRRSPSSRTSRTRSTRSPSAHCTRPRSTAASCARSSTRARTAPRTTARAAG